MTELILFTSSFSLVFALGFQSLNVNNGHYYAAFMTSFVIGAGNIAVLKLAPTPPARRSQPIFSAARSASSAP